MARANTGTTYLYWDGAHIDETAQLAFSVWFNPANTSQTGTRILHFRDDNAGLRGFQVGFNGDGGNYVHVVTSNPATFSEYGEDTTHRLRAAVSVANVWYHVCGTIASTGVLTAAWLDGTAMTDTGGGAWGPGTDNDRLTVCSRSEGAQYLVGRVAEVAVWQGYAIVAADAGVLSKGYSPLFVARGSHVHYSRLMGRATAEYCVVSGKAATHSGTVAQYDHPPIWTPRPGRVLKPAAAAPAATILPRIMGEGLYVSSGGQAA